MTGILSQSLSLAEINEEKFISKCLDSIIDQDYPKDKIEVLVVDGMSGSDRIKKGW